MGISRGYFGLREEASKDKPSRDVISLMIDFRPFFGFVGLEVVLPIALELQLYAEMIIDWKIIYSI